MDDIIIKQCTGFDWDDGNLNKNWYKHSVSHLECEQVFFNEPLLVLEDSKHSLSETIMFALGKTDNHKKLLLVFTIRNHLIRVISARPMSKKERELYEKA